MDQRIASMALKGSLQASLRREVTLKTTPQVFFDDMLCGAGVNAVSGEDFSVDDLFDFSNGGFGVGSQGEEEEEKESGSWLSLERLDDDNSNSSSFSGPGDFDSLSGELAVPVDDLEDLEWLSRFVDDSSAPEFSLLCPAPTGNSWSKRSEEETPPASSLRIPLFPTPVPAKARSKGRRRNGENWSRGSSSPSPSSSSSSSSTSCLIFSGTVPNMESLYNLEKPPTKKQKKLPSTDSLPQRRCSHCLVQKTPQWRTGPLGPKTLCNACGVRYKSGRLFPEYRPACSPTFSGDIHSNSHRKVLEIRRKKEIVESDPG